MEQIILKFRKGKRITDNELLLLWQHYSDLTELLGYHGDIYKLVSNDVYNEFERATNMLKARRKDYVTK